MIKKNNITIYSLLLLLLCYNLFVIYNQEFFNNIKINKVVADDDNYWSSYKDSKLNITTIYPRNWEIIKNKNIDANQSISTVIFRSPKVNSDDLFQPNIVISALKLKNNTPSNESIDLKKIVEKLSGKNKAFMLNNLTTIKIGNNHTGQSISYNFNNGGLFFKTKQIFSMVNKNMYIFSLLTEQKNFNNYSLIFDKMLQNMTISNK